MSEIIHKGPASIRFEEDASKWAAAGRQAPLNPDPWYVMTLYVWSGSKGGCQDGMSEELHAYLETLRAALQQQHPDWYDRLLNTPDCCDRCGESYRLENMSICTNCSLTFAPCHTPQYSYWPNGNVHCSKCHKGEIVG